MKDKTKLSCNRPNIANEKCNNLEAGNIMKKSKAFESGVTN